MEKDELIKKLADALEKMADKDEAASRRMDLMQQPDNYGARALVRMARGLPVNGLPVRRDLW